MRAPSDPLFRSAVGSVLFTAGTLALIAVFLDRHRPELGSFGASARAFAATVGGYGILSPSGAGQSAAVAVAAMLVVLAWYGLGAVLLASIRSAGDKHPCDAARFASGSPPPSIARRQILVPRPMARLIAMYATM